MMTEFFYIHLENESLKASFSRQYPWDKILRLGLKLKLMPGMIEISVVVATTTVVDKILFVVPSSMTVTS